MTTFPELPTHIQLRKNYELTSAITHALSQFIAETNPFLLFNGLLENLLLLTESEYGFIGEVHYDESGQPYIQCYATTNIAWSKKTRELYERTAEQGMKFAKLNTLYGEVLKTGSYVISNEPATDVRSGGLPHGHPALNKFLGIPFFNADIMLGVVGIANRENGYDEPLVEYLNPFLTVCGNLIQAYHNNQQRKIIEQELQHYKGRLEELSNKQLNGFDGHDIQEMKCLDNGIPIELADGYTYLQQHKSLLQHNKFVSLTKKESLLLFLLVSHRNNLVTYVQIEEFVWTNIVVSESSLRALVLRLRKKVPSFEIKTISGIGLSLII